MGKKKKLKKMRWRVHEMTPMVFGIKLSMNFENADSEEVTIVTDTRSCFYNFDSGNFPRLTITNAVDSNIGLLLVPFAHDVKERISNGEKLVGYDIYFTTDGKEVHIPVNSFTGNLDVSTSVRSNSYTLNRSALEETLKIWCNPTFHSYQTNHDAEEIEEMPEEI